MLKSAAGILAGFKGAGAGLALAALWSVACYLIYLFILRKNPAKDARHKLNKNQGIVEAEVIAQYHQEKGRYPKLALFMGLAGPGLILLYTFMR